MSKETEPDYPTCPQCGGHTFNLNVIQIIDVVFNDGEDEPEQGHEVISEPYGDLEWSGTTQAACTHCDYSATLHDMTGKKPKRTIVQATGVYTYPESKPSKGPLR